MTTSCHRIHCATIAAALLLGLAASGATLGAPVRNECSSPPAGTVFCEDFESANPKSHFDDYDGNPDSQNLIVTDAGPSGDSSNKSIRLRVPAGQSGGSDLVKVLPVGIRQALRPLVLQVRIGIQFCRADAWRRPGRRESRLARQLGHSTERE